MVLQFKNEDQQSILLPKLEYDESLQAFRLKNDEEKIEVLVKYPLREEKEFDQKDFLVYLLHHNVLPESHIFELWEKNIDRRIGWIFPIQALQSTSHSYSGNIHFLKLAYIAFSKLLMGEIITFDAPALTKKPFISSIMSLNDFYDSDSVIIILHKPEIEKINGFEICDYIPNLCKYGYTFKFNLLLDINPLLKKEFYVEEAEQKLRERINIKPIAKEFRDDKFIRILFQDKLIKEGHPLVRFHLFYQIIELLIAKVFKLKFNELKNSIDPESVDLFEVRDKILEISSEKKRLNILLSEYTQVESEDLKQLCSIFLNITEAERQNKSLGDFIYGVRSFLVHNYRQIDNHQEELLKDINYHFERFLIAVLIEYKE